MNIILSAINTKFTHKALSLACLKSYWDVFHKDIPLTIKEFDLNILTETIINDLLLMKPDILAFSTYIWSIERIITVCSGIKAAFPNCIIILGGPEVSYNSVDILEKEKNIDFIINGEGEVTFKELIESLLNNQYPETLPGITLRLKDKVVKNKVRQLIKDLDILPSPFLTGNYQGSSNFTYYEASRGCPSKCAYCLSSVQGSVRNRSLELIKKDLDWFFDSDFNQIRFADRTFNFDINRAKEIINYIKINNKKCKNFHFEIQADFLSDEIINLLSDAPRGMFHLEIGVQSTNPKALAAVRRTFDLEEMKSKITKLRKETKCYLHLDVLGGLPYDTYEDFCKSLDDVSSLKPEDIQISLVKVLHGTPFEFFTNKYNIAYMAKPPYTVLKTEWLKPDEAVMISQISKLFEGIKNTERFNKSLEFLAETKFNSSYSKLFESMVFYWRSHKLLFYNFSPENTAKHLSEYSETILKTEKEKGYIKSLLEHELRLTLKSPNVDTFVPDLLFNLSQSKPIYKPSPNIRGYWYRYNPISDFGNSISNSPIVYSFTKDDRCCPLIETLDLKLDEAFTLLAVQKKIPLESLSNLWSELYKGKEMPDFDKIIDNLLNLKFMVSCTHR